MNVNNYPHLWHRGFPLELIPDRDYSKKKPSIICDVQIQVDFWNGDPDVDAICRLEHRPFCTFNDDYFPMASNKISPFNSQNIFIKGGLLEHYFMFPASYYLQSRGANVIYCKPSVIQKRNAHNLVEDFKQECFSYMNTYAMLQDIVDEPYRFFDYLTNRAKKAYQLYRKHF